MGQAERDAAIELRATAPLLAGGKPIGTITLVTAGSHTIGFTSAELCRRNEAAGLAVGTKLDGSASIPLKWSMGRYTGVGLVEPTAPIPADAEIAPLPIAGVPPFEPFLYGDHLWALSTAFVEFRGLDHLRTPRRPATTRKMAAAKA